MTSTRLLITTPLPAVPLDETEGGMVLGTLLAGVALMVVCLCVGWQARLSKDWVGEIILESKDLFLGEGVLASGFEC